MVVVLNCEKTTGRWRLLNEEDDKVTTGHAEWLPLDEGGQAGSLTQVPLLKGSRVARDSSMDVN